MVKGSLPVVVLALLAFMSVASVACSVTPSGQDLFASSSGTNPTPTPTPGPDPVDPPCAAIAASCGANETRYANVTACTSAGEDRCRLVQGTCGGASFYCGSSEVQCLAVPTCDAGDVKVTTCPAGVTCYKRTECGTTITCRDGDANCKAIPVCDVGDIQVTDVGQCNNADCYSRTACGTTIWCENIK